jgi:hypothetical protein
MMAGSDWLKTALALMFVLAALMLMPEAAPAGQMSASQAADRGRSTWLSAAPVPAPRTIKARADGCGPEAVSHGAGPSPGMPTLESAMTWPFDPVAALSDWLRWGAATQEVWMSAMADARAIARQREARLQALLEVAAARSPVYRTRLADAPAGVAGFARLAPIGKAELMAHFDDWVTDPGIRFDEVMSFIADPRRIGEQFLADTPCGRVPAAPQAQASSCRMRARCRSTMPCRHCVARRGRWRPRRCAAWPRVTDSR